MNPPLTETPTSRKLKNPFTCKRYLIQVPNTPTLFVHLQPTLPATKELPLTRPLNIHYSSSKNHQPVRHTSIINAHRSDSRLVRLKISIQFQSTQFTIPKLNDPIRICCLRQQQEAQSAGMRNASKNPSSSGVKVSRRQLAPKRSQKSYRSQREPVTSVGSQALTTTYLVL